MQNGAVQVRFYWTPSGYGSQWLDVSIFNNNFTAGWGNAGPLASNVNSWDWQNLAPNTVYYTRVNTFTSVGFLPSDTISFTTVNCATPFTPPSNPTAQVLTGTSTRFSWDRGVDNQFYCVDTALSLDDLNNFRGTWHNWGCGTTGTSIDATGMICDTTHYWRVWAQGTFTSGYSQTVSFRTGDCGFTPPTNIRSRVLSSTSARFAWDPGKDNQWFCVDVATNVDDLNNLTGSWRNYGCGTNTTVDGTGLDCGTKYVWRVYAHGTTTAGYSSVADFTTGDCANAFSPPTNPRAVNLTATSVRFRWDAGRDNKSYCVDTATSQDDLLNFRGSWANHGCGTTDTTLDVTGLTCDTNYFWRVYAQGTTVAGYSTVAQQKTPACS